MLLAVSLRAIEALHDALGAGCSHLELPPQPWTSAEAAAVLRSRLVSSASDVDIAHSLLWLPLKQCVVGEMKLKPSELGDFAVRLASFISERAITAPAILARLCDVWAAALFSTVQGAIAMSISSSMHPIDFVFSATAVALDLLATKGLMVALFTGVIPYCASAAAAAGGKWVESDASMLFSSMQRALGLSVAVAGKLPAAHQPRILESVFSQIDSHYLAITAGLVRGSQSLRGVVLDTQPERLCAMQSPVVAPDLDPVTGLPARSVMLCMTNSVDLFLEAIAAHKTGLVGGKEDAMNFESMVFSITGLARLSSTTGPGVGTIASTAAVFDLGHGVRQKSGLLDASSDAMRLPSPLPAMIVKFYVAFLGSTKLAMRLWAVERLGSIGLSLENSALFSYEQSQVSVLGTVSAPVGVLSNSDGVAAEPVPEEKDKKTNPSPLGELSSPFVVSDPSVTSPQPALAASAASPSPALERLSFFPARSQVGIDAISNFVTAINVGGNALAALFAGRLHVEVLKRGLPLWRCLVRWGAWKPALTERLWREAHTRHVSEAKELVNILDAILLAEAIALRDASWRAYLAAGIPTAGAKPENMRFYYGSPRIALQLLHHAEETYLLPSERQLAGASCASVPAVMMNAGDVPDFERQCESAWFASSTIAVADPILRSGSASMSAPDNPKASLPILVQSAEFRHCSTAAINESEPLDAPRSVAPSVLGDLAIGAPLARPVSSTPAAPTVLIHILRHISHAVATRFVCLSTPLQKKVICLLLRLYACAATPPLSLLMLPATLSEHRRGKDSVEVIGPAAMGFLELLYSHLEFLSELVPEAAGGRSSSSGAIDPDFDSSCQMETEQGPSEAVALPPLSCSKVYIPLLNENTPPATGPRPPGAALVAFACVSPQAIIRNVASSALSLVQSMSTDSFVTASTTTSACHQFSFRSLVLLQKAVYFVSLLATAEQRRDIVVFDEPVGSILSAKTQPSPPPRLISQTVRAGIETASVPGTVFVKGHIGGLATALIGKDRSLWPALLAIVRRAGVQLLEPECTEGSFFHLSSDLCVHNVFLFARAAFTRLSVTMQPEHSGYDHHLEHAMQAAQALNSQTRALDGALDSAATTAIALDKLLVGLEEDKGEKIKILAADIRCDTCDRTVGCSLSLCDLLQLSNDCASSALCRDAFSLFVADGAGIFFPSDIPLLAPLQPAYAPWRYLQPLRMGTSAAPMQACTRGADELCDDVEQDAMTRFLLPRPSAAATASGNGVKLLVVPPVQASEAPYIMDRLGRPSDFQYQPAIIIQPTQCGPVKFSLSQHPLHSLHAWCILKQLLVGNVASLTRLSPLQAFALRAAWLAVNSDPRVWTTESCSLTDGPVERALGCDSEQVQHLTQRMPPLKRRLGWRWFRGAEIVAQRADVCIYYESSRTDHPPLQNCVGWDALFTVVERAPAAAAAVVAEFVSGLPWLVCRESCDRFAPLVPVAGVRIDWNKPLACASTSTRSTSPIFPVNSSNNLVAPVEALLHLLSNLKERLSRTLLAGTNSSTAKRRRVLSTVFEPQMDVEVHPLMRARRILSCLRRCHHMMQAWVSHAAPGLQTFQRAPTANANRMDAYNRSSRGVHATLHVHDSDANADIVDIRAHLRLYDSSTVVSAAVKEAVDAITKATPNVKEFDASVGARDLANSTVRTGASSSVSAALPCTTLVPYAAQPFGFLNAQANFVQTSSMDLMPSVSLQFLNRLAADGKWPSGYVIDSPEQSVSGDNASHPNFLLPPDVPSDITISIFSHDCVSALQQNVFRFLVDYHCAGVRSPRDIGVGFGVLPSIASELSGRVGIFPADASDLRNPILKHDPSSRLLARNWPGEFEPSGCKNRWMIGINKDIIGPDEAISGRILPPFIHAFPSVVVQAVTEGAAANSNAHLESSLAAANFDCGGYSDFIPIFCTSITEAPQRFMIPSSVGLFSSISADFSADCSEKLFSFHNRRADAEGKTSLLMTGDLGITRSNTRLLGDAIVIIEAEHLLRVANCVGAAHNFASQRAHSDAESHATALFSLGHWQASDASFMRDSLVLLRSAVAYSNGSSDGRDEPSTLVSAAAVSAWQTLSCALPSSPLVLRLIEDPCAVNWDDILTPVLKPSHLHLYDGVSAENTVDLNLLGGATLASVYLLRCVILYMRPKHAVTFLGSAYDPVEWKSRFVSSGGLRAAIATLMAEPVFMAEQGDTRHSITAAVRKLLRVACLRIVLCSFEILQSNIRSTDPGLLIRCNSSKLEQNIPSAVVPRDDVFALLGVSEIESLVQWLWVQATKKEAGGSDADSRYSASASAVYALSSAIGTSSEIGVKRKRYSGVSEGVCASERENNSYKIDLGNESLSAIESWLLEMREYSSVRMQSDGVKLLSVLMDSVLSRSHAATAVATVVPVAMEVDGSASNLIVQTASALSLTIAEGGAISLHRCMGLDEISAVLNLSRNLGAAVGGTAVGVHHAVVSCMKRLAQSSPSIALKALKIGSDVISSFVRGMDPFNDAVSTLVAGCVWDDVTATQRFAQEVSLGQISPASWSSSSACSTWVRTLDTLPSSWAQFFDILEVAATCLRNSLTMEPSTFSVNVESEIDSDLLLLRVIEDLLSLIANVELLLCFTATTVSATPSGLASTSVSHVPLHVHDFLAQAVGMLACTLGVPLDGDFSTTASIAAGELVNKNFALPAALVAVLGVHGVLRPGCPVLGLKSHSLDTQPPPEQVTGTSHAFSRVTHGPRWSTRGANEAAWAICAFVCTTGTAAASNTSGVGASDTIPADVDFAGCVAANPQLLSSMMCHLYRSLCMVDIPAFPPAHWKDPFVHLCLEGASSAPGAGCDRFTAAMLYPLEETSQFFKYASASRPGIEDSVFEVQKQLCAFREVQVLLAAQSSLVQIGPSHCTIDGSVLLAVSTAVNSSSQIRSRGVHSSLNELQEALREGEKQVVGGVGAFGRLMSIFRDLILPSVENVNRLWELMRAAVAAEPATHGVAPFASCTSSSAYFVDFVYGYLSTRSNEPANSITGGMSTLADLLVRSRLSKLPALILDFALREPCNTKPQVVVCSDPIVAHRGEAPVADADLPNIQDISSLSDVVPAAVCKDSAEDKPSSSSFVSSPVSVVAEFALAVRVMSSVPWVQCAVQKYFAFVAALLHAHTLSALSASLRFLLLGSPAIPPLPIFTCGKWEEEVQLVPTAASTGLREPLYSWTASALAAQTRVISELRRLSSGFDTDSQPAPVFPLLLQGLASVIFLGESVATTAALEGLSREDCDQATPWVSSCSDKVLPISTSIDVVRQRLIRAALGRVSAEDVSRAKFRIQAAWNIPALVSTAAHSDDYATFPDGQFGPPSEGSTQRSATPFLGLVNQGATCYMNSLLQQLFMIPSLRHAVLASPDTLNTSLQQLLAARKDPFALPLMELRTQLQSLFGSLCLSQAASLNALPFVQACSVKGFFPLEASVFSQNDAAEFFVYLTDRLGKVFPAEPQVFLTAATTDSASNAGQPPPSPLDVFSATFSGKLQHQIIGTGECTHVVTRDESFNAIEVEVKNLATLEDSLRQYVQGDLLTGDNAYSCSACNKKVDALKRQCFSGNMPDTLVINLKRFELDYSTFSKVKIQEHLSFPALLDVYPFSAAGLAAAGATGRGQAVAPKDSTQADLFPEDGDSLQALQAPSESVADIAAGAYSYQLSGVTIHSGFSASSGHYYSHVRVRQSDTAPSRGSGIAVALNKLAELQELVRLEPACVESNDALQSQLRLLTALAAAHGHPAHQLGDSECATVASDLPKAPLLPTEAEVYSNWYCFNDTSVSPFNASDPELRESAWYGGRKFCAASGGAAGGNSGPFRTANAYMLFYERVWRGTPGVQCRAGGVLAGQARVPPTSDDSVACSSTGNAIRKPSSREFSSPMTVLAPASVIASAQRPNDFYWRQVHTINSSAHGFLTRVLIGRSLLQERVASGAVTASEASAACAFTALQLLVGAMQRRDYRGFSALMDVRPTTEFVARGGATCVVLSYLQSPSRDDIASPDSRFSPLPFPAAVHALGASVRWATDCTQHPAALLVAAMRALMAEAPSADVARNCSLSHRQHRQVTTAAAAEAAGARAGEGEAMGLPQEAAAAVDLGLCEAAVHAVTFPGTGVLEEPLTCVAEGGAGGLQAPVAADVLRSSLFLGHAFRSGDVSTRGPRRVAALLVLHTAQALALAAGPEMAALVAADTDGSLAALSRACRLPTPLLHLRARAAAAVAAAASAGGSRGAVAASAASAAAVMASGGPGPIAPPTVDGLESHEPRLVTSARHCSVPAAGYCAPSKLDALRSAAPLGAGAVSQGKAAHQARLAAYVESRGNDGGSGSSDPFPLLARAVTVPDNQNRELDGASACTGDSDREGRAGLAMTARGIHGYDDGYDDDNELRDDGPQEHDDDPCSDGSSPASNSSRFNSSTAVTVSEHAADDCVDDSGSAPPANASMLAPASGPRAPLVPTGRVLTRTLSAESAMGASMRLDVPDVRVLRKLLPKAAAFIRRDPALAVNLEIVAVVARAMRSVSVPQQLAAVMQQQQLQQQRQQPRSPLIDLTGMPAEPPITADAGGIARSLFRSDYVPNVAAGDHHHPAAPAPAAVAMMLLETHCDAGASSSGQPLELGSHATSPGGSGGPEGCTAADGGGGGDGVLTAFSPPQRAVRALDALLRSLVPFLAAAALHPGATAPADPLPALAALLRDVAAAHPLAAALLVRNHAPQLLAQMLRRAHPQMFAVAAAGGGGGGGGGGTGSGFVQATLLSAQAFSVAPAQKAFTAKSIPLAQAGAAPSQAHPPAAASTAAAAPAIAAAAAAAAAVASPSQVLDALVGQMPNLTDWASPSYGGGSMGPYGGFMTASNVTSAASAVAAAPSRPPPPRGVTITRSGAGFSTAAIAEVAATLAVLVRCCRVSDISLPGAPDLQSPLPRLRLERAAAAAATSHSDAMPVDGSGGEEHSRKGCQAERTLRLLPWLDGASDSSGGGPCTLISAAAAAARGGGGGGDSPFAVQWGSVGRVSVDGVDVATATTSGGGAGPSAPCPRPVLPRAVGALLLSPDTLGELVAAAGEGSTCYPPLRCALQHAAHGNPRASFLLARAAVSRLAHNGAPTLLPNTGALLTASLFGGCGGSDAPSRGAGGGDSSSSSSSTAAAVSKPRVATSGLGEAGGMWAAVHDLALHPALMRDGCVPARLAALLFSAYVPHAQLAAPLLLNGVQAREAAAAAPTVGSSNALDLAPGSERARAGAAIVSGGSTAVLGSSMPSAPGAAVLSDATPADVGLRSSFDGLSKIASTTAACCRPFASARAIVDPWRPLSSYFSAPTTYLCEGDNPPVPASVAARLAAFGFVPWLVTHNDNNNSSSGGDVLEVPCIGGSSEAAAATSDEFPGVTSAGVAGNDSFHDEGCRLLRAPEWTTRLAPSDSLAAGVSGAGSLNGFDPLIPRWGPRNVHALSLVNSAAAMTPSAFMARPFDGGAFVPVQPQEQPDDGSGNCGADVFGQDSAAAALVSAALGAATDLSSENVAKMISVISSSSNGVAETEQEVLSGVSLAQMKEPLAADAISHLPPKLLARGVNPASAARARTANAAGPKGRVISGTEASNLVSRGLPQSDCGPLVPLRRTGLAARLLDIAVAASLSGPQASRFAFLLPSVNQMRPTAAASAVVSSVSDATMQIDEAAAAGVGSGAAITDPLITPATASKLAFGRFKLGGPAAGTILSAGPADQWDPRVSMSAWSKAAAGEPSAAGEGSSSTATPADHLPLHELRSLRASAVRTTGAPVSAASSLSVRAATQLPPSYTSAGVSLALVADLTASGMLGADGLWELALIRAKARPQQDATDHAVALIAGILHILQWLRNCEEPGWMSVALSLPTLIPHAPDVARVIVLAHSRLLPLLSAPLLLAHSQRLSAQQHDAYDAATRVRLRDIICLPRASAAAGLFCEPGWQALGARPDVTEDSAAAGPAAGSSTPPYPPLHNGEEINSTLSLRNFPPQAWLPAHYLSLSVPDNLPVVAAEALPFHSGGVEANAGRGMNDPGSSISPHTCEGASNNASGCKRRRYELKTGSCFVRGRSDARFKGKGDYYRDDNLTSRRHSHAGSGDDSDTDEAASYHSSSSEGPRQQRGARQLDSVNTPHGSARHGGRAPRSSQHPAQHPAKLKMSRDGGPWCPELLAAAAALDMTPEDYMRMEDAPACAQQVRYSANLRAGGSHKGKRPASAASLASRYCRGDAAIVATDASCSVLQLESIGRPLHIAGPVLGCFHRTPGLASPDKVLSVVLQFAQNARGKTGGGSGGAAMACLDEIPRALPGLASLGELLGFHPDVAAAMMLGMIPPPAERENNMLLLDADPRLVAQAPLLARAVQQFVLCSSHCRDDGPAKLRMLDATPGAEAQAAEDCSAMLLAALPCPFQALLRKLKSRLADAGSDARRFADLCGGGDGAAAALRVVNALLERGTPLQLARSPEAATLAAATAVSDGGAGDAASCGDSAAATLAPPPAGGPAAAVGVIGALAVMNALVEQMRQAAKTRGCGPLLV